VWPVRPVKRLPNATVVALIMALCTKSRLVTTAPDGTSSERFELTRISGLGGQWYEPHRTAHGGASGVPKLQRCVAVRQRDPGGVSQTAIWTLRAGTAAR
jgi:hypothetical protein